MNPLLTILRAAHCRSTHHFFAIDALPLLGTESGQRLGQILLRHHDRYLTGAKDPDTRFRDFQNHVIHVTDGYWGGAPRVAHQWYDRMHRYLKTHRYGDAAHAAGVLSHYFTDPLMPLHTQQSEREKVLHRPIEWSVTKSYQTIKSMWEDDHMRVVFDLSDGSEWLGEAILHGARHANKYYFPLLETYDLVRGRKEPTRGLSLVAKGALAELFGLAITGWARVLERIAWEAESASGAELPRQSLTVAMLIAATKSPSRYWIKRIENRRERTAVEALVKEFERTGDLKENLPVEVDIVHRVIKVHADEKDWRKRREQLRSSETKISIENPAGKESPSVSQPATIPFAKNDLGNSSDQFTPPVRFRLRPADDLVDAPSIGPKTAERFAAIGITTVSQFLAADVESMKQRLATRWITSKTLSLWKTQASVMCQVPGLKCVSAQLLAGAEFSSCQAVANSDPAQLHAAVSVYAATTSGRRYLRGSSPPSVNDVALWIENAQSCESRIQRAA